MASNPLYKSPLVGLYQSIGRQMGVSPAFINASIAQGISESSLNPNATGDGGQARGLHQWHPDRYNNLLSLSQKMNLPPTDPRVQITFWNNENKANWGIDDPVKANAAALASERPAGWKPGDPTGVPSYNKRLGDTMALMRMTNGQPNPQDPNSFVATAPNAPVPTESISPQAQAFNLGDEENTQPLNNIGSTLANMGASIASLDRGGTGIASLNASKVASNLAAQELAREKQGGWKYAGQTQNGQGMVFQNAKGQIRVEPLAEGYTGQKEPDSLKVIDALAADPKRMAAYKEMHSPSEDSKTPPLADADYDRFLQKEIAGGTLGATEFGTGKGSNENRIAYQQFKTKALQPLGLTEDDLIKAKSNFQYRTKMARDLGGTENRFTLAYNNFMGGSKVLEDYAKAYPREWPKIIEAARQGSILGLNIPGLGAKELGALDTAFDTTAVEYAKAKNPGNSQITVTELNDARQKFRSTMGQEELSGRLEAMRRELEANRQRMMGVHSAVIGEKVDSPLTSAVPEDIVPGKQPMIRGDSPEPTKTTSPDAKNAIPMPSRITSPADFDAYVRENKIPPGTPFRMGDRVIYSK